MKILFCFLKVIFNNFQLLLYAIFTKKITYPVRMFIIISCSKKRLFLKTCSAYIVDFCQNFSHKNTVKHILVIKIISIVNSKFLSPV